jgi:hypothetical protein
MQLCFCTYGHLLLLVASTLPKKIEGDELQRVVGLILQGVLFRFFINMKYECWLWPAVVWITIDYILSSSLLLHLTVP